LRASDGLSRFAADLSLAPRVHVTSHRRAARAARQ
jgi:hypothetical protein